MYISYPDLSAVIASITNTREPGIDIDAAGSVQCSAEYQYSIVYMLSMGHHMNPVDRYYML